MTDYLIYTVFIIQVIVYHATSSSIVTFFLWIAGGCIVGFLNPILQGNELKLFDFLIVGLIYMVLTFFMIFEIIISIISAWNHRVAEWILNFLTILSIMLSIIGSSYKEDKEDKEEKKMGKIKSQELINHKTDKLSKNSFNSNFIYSDLKN